LLKGCDERGFTFFTNYNGAKGQHLASNPRAALTFWWGALERPGEYHRDRSPDDARGVGALLPLAARSRVSSGLGLRPRAKSLRIAASSSRSSPRRGCASREARSRFRTIGADTGSSRKRWNFGKAAGADCTTACATRAPPTAGRSSGFPRSLGTASHGSHRSHRPIYRLLRAPQLLQHRLGLLQLRP
jgi:hypothetical protein